MKTAIDIYDDASLIILTQADEYRMPEVPENVRSVLEKIKNEKDIQQAEKLAEKAIKKMQIMCLGFWARGKAKGPKNG